MLTPSEFCFRTTDNIGVADAESDQEFLRDCFVDNGELGILEDCADPRCFIIGRTGVGKTALLSTLKEAAGERGIEVRPEELALAHISNSTILRYVSEELGVSLDPFFKLLWRHVFVVEIIKRRFRIENAADRDGIMAKLSRFLSGPSDREQKWKRALAYLEKHGPSFWLETDVRIKEVTQKLEDSLHTSLGTPEKLGDIPLPSAKLSVGTQRTEEQKLEHVQRAQRVVNDVQIRELAEVLELLDGVLDDPMKPYYLLVDRLDENWVEDRIRYQLIRALLETGRDFYKIRNAKLVIAMRRDLVDRVFRLTRGAGFQEEKYKSQFLQVSWTKEKLTDVLDARIKHLVRRRYTKAVVSHIDVLPSQVDGESGIDFIIRRSLMRPRNVIMFFNSAILMAQGAATITSDRLKEAEGAYSRERLRCLADEWHADYPNLLRFVDILKKRNRRFRLGTITDHECEAFCNQVASESLSEDPLQHAVWELSSGADRYAIFRRTLAHCFYACGLVGLKIEAFEKVSWAINERTVSPSEISDGTKLEVSPCFWRVLGVRKGDS